MTPLSSVWSWQVKIINSSNVTSSRNTSLVSSYLGWGQRGVIEPQLECNGTLAFPALFCAIILGKVMNLGQRIYIHNNCYLSLSLRFFPCSRNWHTVKVDSTVPVYCTRRPGLFFPPISWARLLPLYEPWLTPVLNKISILHMLPQPYFDYWSQSLPHCWRRAHAQLCNFPTVLFKHQLLIRHSVSPALPSLRVPLKRGCW